MGRFLLRRFLFFMLTLFLTSLIIFILTHVLPGDVAKVLLGRDASIAELEGLRIELGLDQPLPVQYTRWAADFFTSDWGITFSRPRLPIRQIVLERFGKSAQLGLLILALSVPLAIVLGVIAGLTEGKLPDNLISIGSLSVASLPEFVTGLFLINILALQMGWFPPSSSIRPDASFRESLPALWLPAIAASLVLIAYIARLVRAGVIEEMKQEYVRTAILKGLPYRTVIFKHVLRNALIPAITVIASSTGWLISGLVVVEFVFSYPGMGRLLMFAIEHRDLPLIQAITMVTVAVILTANLAADLLYMILNPRISLA
jgi:peptide/nickel transport system permease protein